jgi:hypothetical protein
MQQQFNTFFSVFGQANLLYTNDCSLRAGFIMASLWLVTALVAVVFDVPKEIFSALLNFNFYSLPR